MLASELYARSQSAACYEGREQCHWCRTLCNQKWTHDDIPFLPFAPSPQKPKNPAGHYVCSGCWHWRRTSITVNFLGGQFKDRQQTKDHSWYVSLSEAWALNNHSGDLLYKKLLRPQEPFFLSILTGNRVPNLIHLIDVNAPEKGKDTAESTWKFYIDMVPYSYSVYELEMGLKHGPDGKSSGVRELIRLFGRKEEKVVVTVPNNSVGRPAVDNATRHKEMQRMKRHLR